MLLPLALLACTSAPPSAPPQPPPLTSPRPNIILVSLDTVRGDHGPGAAGPGVMPHFAAFAERGVRFDQAWAPASNTLVSHGSLFTGLPPWEHAFHPGASPPAQPPPLLPLLAEAGYTVGVFTTLPIWLGPTHGFDAGAQAFRSEMVPGSTALTWVADWLATAPPRPLALFVHLYDAHSDTNRLPYESPHPPMDAFDGCVEELCASRLLRAVDEGTVALSPQAAEAIRSQYAAGVRATDALLGELLALLEPLGEQTFVAVFSDHGELLGEEGWLHHGSHPAVLDIPLAVRWPGGEPRQLVSPTPVSLMDLYPTVLQVANLAPDGRPGLRQLIEGHDARTVKAMGAARIGPRMVFKTRAGAVAALQRGEDGAWTATEVDEALARLAPP